VIELAIGIAIGLAVRQFHKQIWAGIKNLFADVVKKLAGKPAAPVPTPPKAPAQPPKAS
jgi:hypothetical protein